MGFFWHQLSFRLGFHNRSLARFPVHLGNLNIVTPASICYKAKIKGDSYFFERDEMVSTIWILENLVEEIHFQNEIEPLLHDSKYEVIHVAAREVFSSGSRQPLEAWLEVRDIKFETDDLERLPSTRGIAPRALRLPECLLLGSINGRYEILAGETVSLLVPKQNLMRRSLSHLHFVIEVSRLRSPQTEFEPSGVIRRCRLCDDLVSKTWRSDLSASTWQSCFEAKPIISKVLHSSACFLGSLGLIAKDRSGNGI